ncbi:Fic family protein [Fusobacterium varium]
MKLKEKMTEEYLDDLLVRIAHHSTAIEGNTISLNGTISIILDDTIPGGTSKREFYEVENHKQTIDYILKCLDNGEKLDIGIVKEVNNNLMDHLNIDKGKFKTNSNAIKGADFETASPSQTPTLMYQWVDNLNYRLENTSSEDEKIKAILDSHIKFERIHPFSDGNGRTGRILMMYSMLEHEIPPLVITKDFKSNYMEKLREQDVEGLFEICKPLIEKERDRIEKFFNKEKVQIKDLEKKTEEKVIKKNPWAKTKENEKDKGNER